MADESSRIQDLGFIRFSTSQFSWSEISRSDLHIGRFTFALVLRPSGDLTCSQPHFAEVVSAEIDHLLPWHALNRSDSPDLLWDFVSDGLRLFLSYIST
jgi:hypothetical protein